MPKLPINPLFVLVGGLAIALGLWYSWLTLGIEFAHRRAAATLPAPVAQVGAPAADAGKPADIRAAYFAEAGQTGDAFGALNALLTAIAGALVAWAGYMQYLSLHEVREEARLERKARQKEEFESLFFRMLDLSRELTNRIEFSKPPQFRSGEPLPGGASIGASALDALANEVKGFPVVQTDPEKVMIQLVDDFLSNVYELYPSAFGPYFRLMYQTFRHVSQSALEEKEKVQYANIARGQISEGAVFLLALNGLTPYGHSFIRYIEQFGLLEHMQAKDKRKYEAAFLTGYRPRAFLGSAGRAAHQHVDASLQNPSHFVEGFLTL